MFIEVLHDNQGNIFSCYESDPHPINYEKELFINGTGMEGLTRARINIDTLQEMEIEENTVTKATLEKNGEPQVVNISRSAYIIDNMMIDMVKNIPLPTKVKRPKNLKFRELKNKTT